MLLALLLGCTAAPQLRLASDAERLPAPRFTVEGPRGARWEGASFSISACPLQPLLWALTAPGTLSPPLQLTSGRAPAGLQPSAPAQPLGAGRLYLAAFVVGHQSSTQVFRVEPDGRVVGVVDGQACAGAAPLQNAP